jgi:DNA-binding LacI/PurR family transcriptional regulator
MRPFTSLSLVDQFVAHLREAIVRGDLSGTMPGIRRLAKVHGLGTNTVIAAVERLESKGFLVPQGVGKRSRITLPEGVRPQGLRVIILLYEKNDAKVDYMVTLRYQLQEMGFSADFAEKSLCELGMDLKRVARLVKKAEADAWIIFGAPREVLEWFAAGPVPAFSLSGWLRSVDIGGAGPDKLDAIVAVVRRLTGLGHQRIVLLSREERRKPVPGAFEQAFLEEMKARGASIGRYNFPDWEDTPEGFHACLTSLFQHTPPTALIPDTLELYMATMHFLTGKGIRVPADVSLVCTDPHPGFDWFVPSVAYITYDSNFWVRKAVQWVDKVARGKVDRRQFFCRAEFVDGPSIGPIHRPVS